MEADQPDQMSVLLQQRSADRWERDGKSYANPDERRQTFDEVSKEETGFAGTMGESGDDCCFKRIKIRGVRNQAAREFLAELYGTFLLALIGTGAGCQITLSEGRQSSYLTVNLASGIAVAMGIYIAGYASGGAVNPAISLSYCLSKRTPWKYLPAHWLGQLIGSFAAAATTFGIYQDAIDHFDGGKRQAFGPNGTAAMFTSFPKPYVSSTTCFFDQVVGTGIMITLVMAFMDPRNLMPNPGFAPMLTAASVTAIGGTFGFNCGYPLNPARDLGPRLFLMVAGWPTEVFSYRDYNWFWVPIVGPLVGGAVSTALYYIFVGFHWPPKPGKEEKKEDLAMKLHQNDNGSNAKFDPSSGVVDGPSYNHSNNAGLSHANMDDMKE